METTSRMSDDFIDLTVTSPPYDNLRDYKGYSWDFEALAKELFRITKPGGVVVWVVGDATVNGSETGTSFRQALYFMECGFRLHDTMIYERNCAYPGNIRYSQDFEFMFVFANGNPSVCNIIKDKKSATAGRKAGKVKKLLKNGKRVDEKTNRKRPIWAERSNIWKYNTGGGVSSNDKSAFKHPAIFPEKLAADHIYTWSNPVDLIYDPFMGSGTTAKMAHLLGRNWIGSEISQEYVDLANERLEPYLEVTPEGPFDQAYLDKLNGIKRPNYSKAQNRLF